MKIQIGDRVRRVQKGAYKYSGPMPGTVVEEPYKGKFKVKWDEKAGTGQQHSTVDEKMLERI